MVSYKCTRIECLPLYMKRGKCSVQCPDELPIILLIPSILHKLLSCYSPLLLFCFACTIITVIIISLTMLWMLSLRSLEPSCILRSIVASSVDWGAICRVMYVAACSSIVASSSSRLFSSCSSLSSLWHRQYFWNEDCRDAC